MGDHPGSSLRRCGLLQQGFVDVYQWCRLSVFTYSEFKLVRSVPPHQSAPRSVRGYESGSGSGRVSG